MKTIYCLSQQRVLHAMPFKARRLYVVDSGSNADGHWNETPRAIAIIIKPPIIWSGFIALCFLGFISLIYFSVRLYFQQKLERNIKCFANKP